MHTVTQIDEYRWEIKRTGNMRVPGIVYCSRAMMAAMDREDSLTQVANVAHLPGIVKASLAMPDIHWGYGFPIGGVAAFDWQEGVISPGGVGYDINCGVRLARSALVESDVQDRLDDLVNALYSGIPTGVGVKGSVRLSLSEEKQVLRQGSRWAVRQGFGEAADLVHTEDEGCLPNADPEKVSGRALERGRQQLGTLGSGNHFLEVGVVDSVYDPKAAEALGLYENQITIMLHTGSRGFGHQVCDDFLAQMAKDVHKNRLTLPDRQLACAPIQSPAGRDYLSAMACAANYAWANRQILLDQTRKVFQRVMHAGPRSLAIDLVYDVCHNMAKRETHIIDGCQRELCVHRKGATRAFAPGHAAVCTDYRAIGQPILIPGDMGTASYVLVGTHRAMAETFGSTCHGAGRRLSRSAAKKACKGRAVHRELADKGIRVKWTGRATLAEEMPDAYKSIDEVVAVVHNAGISRKVARLRPLAVIKG